VPRCRIAPAISLKGIPERRGLIEPIERKERDFKTARNPHVNYTWNIGGPAIVASLNIDFRALGKKEKRKKKKGKRKKKGKTRRAFAERILADGARSQRHRILSSLNFLCRPRKPRRVDNSIIGWTGMQRDSKAHQRIGRTK
jgi:hypothetical protein